MIGYDIRRGVPTLKIGHHDNLPVGSGCALNANTVLCLDVNSDKVATGWDDGSVRVFAVSSNMNDGIIRSLLHRSVTNEGLHDPLTLNGHGSPVQIVSFEKSAAAVRLASGSSDGIIILWDIVAESGLFRLLGHTGPITGISFVVNEKMMDGLVTSGSDGLVKVWDLNEQCCIQTLVGHRGKVGCLALSALKTGENERKRLVTGCVDGQIRVWSVNGSDEAKYESNDDDKEGEVATKNDDVFTYMGSLHPPSNLPTATNNEGIASIHFHRNGKYLGICRANDRFIEIYVPRSEVEVQKKRKRRLQRRREKQNAASNSEKGPKKRGILDDPESDDEDKEDGAKEGPLVVEDHEAIKAMDEFEFRGTVRSSHKIRSFAFVPTSERGGGIRIALALATNAFEVYSLPSPKDGSASPVTAEKVSSLDMYGHPTGIRSVALSSEDSMACTASKNVVKVWNVAKRSCLRSLTISGSAFGSNTSTSYYCLCVAFLPGNTHIVLGTREGHILIMDVASGDLVYTEDNAHDGAIWSLDLHNGHNNDTMSLVTGSADKLVKYWDIESQEDETDSSHQQHPMIVHARTLQMSDDIMCVRFSHSTDPSTRFIFVASLDSTIKVFFDDSLKFFLSLYGHKLPVLALDSSDDDTILGKLQIICTYFHSDKCTLYLYPPFSH